MIEKSYKYDLKDCISDRNFNSLFDSSLRTSYESYNVFL